MLHRLRVHRLLVPNETGPLTNRLSLIIVVDLLLRTPEIMCGVVRITSPLVLNRCMVWATLWKTLQ